MAVWSPFGLSVALLLLPQAARVTSEATSWNLRVARVMRAVSSPRPERSAGVRLRVVRSLTIEAVPDFSDRTYVIEVGIHNDSRSTQWLRWDLARSLRLVLPDDRNVQPIGYRLLGISDNALATGGVLDVQVPSDSSYIVRPAFLAERLPAGTRMVFDNVGTASLRFEAGRWKS